MNEQDINKLANDTIRDALDWAREDPEGFINYVTGVLDMAKEKEE